MASKFLVLLAISGSVLTAGPDPGSPKSLLVNFFNILYSKESLDFHYDFGNTSSAFQGVGLVSVWGPMKLLRSSYSAKVDNFTKLISIELMNQEHILVNANTYNDLELKQCELHLEFALVKMAGTTVRPISLRVDNCHRVSFIGGAVVQDSEDILAEVSRAILWKAKEYLEFYFSDRPRLSALGLEEQQQLFAAFLFYS